MHTAAISRRGKSPLALLGVLLLVLLAASARADSLNVAAAANLRVVLTEALIPAFTKATGTTVIPTFGSTKLLATQLENGAPFDVFVAADTESVDGLVAKHLVDPKTARVYAVGQLALWSRKDAAHHPARVRDLARPEYTKIAIANPSLAPYGRAAMEAFAHEKVTEAVQPKLAQAENIAQALQFAQSGNADVAVTALSLVINDHDNPHVIVPAEDHAPIRQSLAVTTAGVNASAARAFADFLTSRAAGPIWKRYGYALPGRKG